MAQILYVCRRVNLSIHLDMPGIVYIAIAFSEFCQPGNADHRMINLSVAWLIMQSLGCYTVIYSVATYMTILLATS